MTNPATELADLLERWTSAETKPTVYASRGGGYGEIALWREQGRAVSPLLQIERAITVLQEQTGSDMHHFEQYIPGWYESIFQPEQAWNSPFAGSPADPAAFSQLRSLALVIGLAKVDLDLGAGQGRTLLESIGDAVSLIGSSAGEKLPPNQRAYVYWLPDEVRRCIESRSIVDSIDLRSRIDQLNGSLLTVAAQFEEIDEAEAAASASSVARRIANLVRSVLYDVAALAQIAGTAAGFLAITPGDAPPAAPGE
jgi:hypothetical protein